MSNCNICNIIILAPCTVYSPFHTLTFLAPQELQDNVIQILFCFEIQKLTLIQSKILAHTFILNQRRHACTSKYKPSICISCKYSLHCCRKKGLLEGSKVIQRCSRSSIFKSTIFELYKVSPITCPPIYLVWHKFKYVKQFTLQKDKYLPNSLYVCGPSFCCA